MIRSLIQIEGGEVLDFYEAFGFIYMDADERTAPDEKEDAVSSYAEEAGEHRDGRRVYAPFDYTAKFLVESPNKDKANINVKIAAFNNAIREQISDSALTRMKEIAFYNLLNRVKIVGYPELIAVPTEVYHSNRYGEMDFAVVELKIRVSDPKKCDFALATDKEEQENPNAMTLRLKTDGGRIFVETSRPLADDEALLLMTRGSVKNHKNFGGNTDIYYKGRFRWHVRYHGFKTDINSIHPNLDEANILRGGQIRYEVLDWIKPQERHYVNNYDVHQSGVLIRKSSGSRKFIFDRTGVYGITYGCAVYKKNPMSVGGSFYRPKRVSNVAYFMSNVEIYNVDSTDAIVGFRSWLST